MPLAAHHTSPPKATIMRPAPTAAVLPASFLVSAAHSHASAPRAAKERIHAGHKMAFPRAPSAQKGARTSGQSKLVAPLEADSPAWKRSGCPSAMARAYWKWI
jgi:hypothetical protein